MISAYLRQQGIRVVQRDLNIELCHQLMTRHNLARYLGKLSHGRHSFHITYRQAMAKYLLHEEQSLVRRVFRRKADDNSDDMTQSVRLVRQGIDLLLESSVLSRSISSFEELDAMLGAEAETAMDDDPALLLRDMVMGLIGSVRPVILGVSVAFFSQLLPAFLLARWAKASNPSTTVILGGQQVLLWGDRLAQLDAFGRDVDCLGTGKGEETLLQLHDAIAGEGDVSCVPDLIYWSSAGPRRTEIHSKLRLRDLPPPDFSGLPIRSYLIGQTQLAIITCVGCYWGRCVFCSYGNRSYRERSYEQLAPEQIADWCQALIDQHGVTRINFVDENTNLRLVLRGVRLLNERGYRIQFSTRNRLEDQLLDPAFCKELSDRGCVLMSCGYETNSQRLLDQVKKGVNAANYQRIIDTISATGITLRLSVLGGLPGETEEEHRESVAFLRRNEKKIGIDVVQMLVAEPKTFLSDELDAFDLEGNRDDELRGNRELSFGQGRMGYLFEYRHGEKYTERRDRFIRDCHEIRPQRNDELPPDQAYRTGVGASNSKVSGVMLFPWVQVHSGVQLREGGAPSDLLVDLLWQRFYRLPQDLDWRASRSHRTYLSVGESGKDSAQDLLMEIVDLRLGSPTDEQAAIDPPARLT